MSDGGTTSGRPARDLPTTVFRALIIGMFGIIVTMTGIIMSTMTKATDTLSVSETILERRVNDMGERLAKAETRICDLQAVRC